jgi:hypothetical protein
MKHIVNVLVCAVVLGFGLSVMPLAAAEEELPILFQENYTDSVATQVFVCISILGIKTCSNEGPVGEAEATIGLPDHENTIGDVNVAVEGLVGPIARLRGVEDEAHVGTADTEALTTIPELNVLGGLGSRSSAW